MSVCCKYVQLASFVTSSVNSDEIRNACQCFHNPVGAHCTYVNIIDPHGICFTSVIKHVAVIVILYG